jgi:archaellum component FlaC
VSKLDEVSQAIGKLQGKVEGMEKTQNDIVDKLELIHNEQTGQKIETAKISGKVGFFSAIATFGAIEGFRYWIKSHGS